MSTKTYLSTLDSRHSITFTSSKILSVSSMSLLARNIQSMIMKMGNLGYSADVRVNQL